jgi:hypothetical protein
MIAAARLYCCQKIYFKAAPDAQAAAKIEGNWLSGNSSSIW